MLQNAYFLAKIGADTAENEQHFAKNLRKTDNYPTATELAVGCDYPRQRWAQQGCVADVRQWVRLFERLAEVPRENIWLLTDEGETSDADTAATLRTRLNNIEYFPPNFEGLVLGCIDADFCK